MCRAKVQREIVGDVTVLHVSGHLVQPDECQRLREPIQELLSAGKVNMVLNLENCLCIGAGGIDALASGLVSARKRGGHMQLANLTGWVAGTLRASRFIPPFRVQNLEKAIAGFRQVVD